MKDPQLYKATKEAISRFHSVLGVRERNIKLADLDGPTMGISGDGGIYLNKRYYNKSYKDLVGIEKRDYKKGFDTVTNKPQTHIVTHELAHSLWSRSKTGANHKAAEKRSNRSIKSGVQIQRKKDTGLMRRNMLMSFGQKL